MGPLKPMSSYRPAWISPHSMGNAAMIATSSEGKNSNIFKRFGTGFCVNVHFFPIRGSWMMSTMDLKTVN